MTGVTMRDRKELKGSLSIEAAVALPLFTCFILGFVMLIKVFTAHEIIQHAINQTAQEMAGYSYIYSKTTELAPVLGNTALKAILEKNLSNGNQDADAALKRLGVVKGLSGFDFSLSKILANKKDIEIIVRYKLKAMLPVKIIPDLYLVQRSTSKAWLDPVNDTEDVPPEDNAAADNVWDLDPMKRGMLLQNKFGRNLPSGYPVLTSYDPDKKEAVVIKSIDLYSTTYLKGENLQSRVNSIINELKAFKGADYSDISIDIHNIRTKSILIVVPLNSIREDMKAVFDKAKSYAMQNGIQLNVKEYGTKSIQK
jgi:hypothetical protein